MQADEPDFTRNKARVFLSTHTCYELIPESGKVVILDVGLPIRQAFHALHEQVSGHYDCDDLGVQAISIPWPSTSSIIKMKNPKCLSSRGVCHGCRQSPVRPYGMRIRAW